MGESEKTVGLLGGSFDPPHMGHVLLCAVGVAGLGLDEVWLLPCRCHPFGKPLTPFEHRARMCALAVAALGKRVRVERIEASLGAEDEPSFTADTVAALRERHPAITFRLLIGSDLVQELKSWRDHERLVAMAKPLVVPRMGYRQPSRRVEGPETLPALSSSGVRERAASGKSLEGWVPRAVEEYIVSKGLYGAAVRS
ncbi:nicotinate (nicotinamide) nucleotide adenylyltransferase [Candidatus Sumerlaeota bacterium]|nr:nicotinate (nicotinamide) nucleotide adenylyltransferase [Candidatus Sumerlaeota bacterium]